MAPRPTSQKPAGRYPLLSQVTDPVSQQIHKLVYDRLTDLENNHATLTAAVAKIVPGTTPAEVQALIAQATVVTPPPARLGPQQTGSGGGGGGGGGGGYPLNLDITIGQPAGVPAAPNKRWFRGNFGGIRVPGLPGIPDGPNNTIPGGDTTMLWCPYFHRYPAIWQAAGLAAYVARGYTHFEISWAAAQADGLSVAQFVALAQQITSAGLYCVTELCGKGTPGDGADYVALAMQVIPSMIAAGVIPIAYMGKELNLGLSPTDLQIFIDGVAPTLVAAGTNVYVHFSSGVMSWQVTGNVKDFWIPNVGKLTGVLYQQDPTLDPGALQNDLTGTILTRCAGNDGMPADSGFGHPFDCVAYELTAEAQFFPPNISEQQGDLQGFAAVCAPPASGPGGTVVVMGFGNGAAYPNGTRL